MTEAAGEIFTAFPFLGNEVRAEEPLEIGHPGLWELAAYVQAALSPSLKASGKSIFFLLCISQYYCILCTKTINVATFCVGR